MEIRTEIDEEGGLRRHKITGRVTTSELVAALESLYSTFPRTEELSSLWDLTEAEVDLKADEVRALAELVTQNWGKTGRARSAIVVTEDLAFGLARMYESMVTARTSSPVRICRELDQAVAWLAEGSGT